MMVAATAGDRRKILRRYRTGIILILICMYGAFGLPYEVASHMHNFHSYVPVYRHPCRVCLAL